MSALTTSDQLLYLAAIVRSSADAIVSQDLAGTVTTWNPAAETMFGYPSSYALGRPLASLSIFDPGQSSNAGPNHLTLKNATLFEALAKHKSGVQFPVSVTAFPLLDHTGRLLGKSTSVRLLRRQPSSERSQEDIDRELQQGLNQRKAELDAEISQRKKAEDRFRLVVEAAPNSMLMVGVDGRIALVNSQTEKLFGYDRGELLGQKMEMLVPERFRALHLSHRANFFDAPTVRAMGRGRDLFGLRKNGTEVPIEIGLNPITTAEGRFVLASIIDITERRRADERFRLVVEAAPNAMIMVGSDGSIALVNSQTEKLFGYDREDLLGQRVEMLVPERFRSAHRDLRGGFFNAPTARAMGSGRDLFGIRKNGTEVPIEIGLNPISSPEGNFILTSIIDITERKRAQDEVAAAKLEVESRNKDLETMLHVTSHDLREPLRAIRNFTLILSERYSHQIDDKGKDLLNRVRGGAERLDRLVQDILDVTRARRILPPDDLLAGRLIVADALRVLNSRIADTHAHVHIAGDLPSLRVSLAWGSVAIQNLIANALKFTHQNTPPEIEICPYQSHNNQEAGIMVRDRGIGVPERHAERIFELFQRAVGREVEGTGAGLAIVRQIAERHGGRAWVQPREGGGSDFIITFGRAPRRELFTAAAH
jgi:PAS domain S-box-containing protein